MDSALLICETLKARQKVCNHCVDRSDRTEAEESDTSIVASLTATKGFIGLDKTFECGEEQEDNSLEDSNVSAPFHTLVDLQMDRQQAPSTRRP